ncbi:MAG: GIY-YIG nuclease family protein, partial [Promethearchaeota archaeon]
MEYKSNLYPDAPGVYLMKDRAGKVIYVGKAKSLRRRIGQYFQDLSGRFNMNVEKIRALTSSVCCVDVIRTNNEREALLLENELIKLYQPRYNTRLKDDKSFPYIMITCEDRFPRVVVIRGVHLYSKRNLFFGPYIDKGSVVRTLKMIRNIFPYCSCYKKISNKPRKPCLYYHLGLCLAPCAWPDDDKLRERYLENIKNVIFFLRGNYQELLERLEQDMNNAKERLDYEYAAVIRDEIKALKRVFKPQSVIFKDRENVDIISLARDGFELVYVVINVRNGRLIGKVPYIYDIRENISSMVDVFLNFSVSYYIDGGK